MSRRHIRDICARSVGAQDASPRLSSIPPLTSVSVVEMSQVVQLLAEKDPLGAERGAGPLPKKAGDTERIWVCGTPADNIHLPRMLVFLAIVRATRAHTVTDRPERRRWSR